MKAEILVGISKGCRSLGELMCENNIKVNHEHRVTCVRYCDPPSVAGGQLLDSHTDRVVAVDRCLYVKMLSPHCLDNRLTDGGKVVSPTHRPLSTPHKHYFSAFGTHFC
jgi:hypothetical protein